MEVRLLKMLEIIVSHGLECLEEPAARARVDAALREAGYWEFEVARMFEWLGQLRDEPDFHEQIGALLSPSSRDEGGPVEVMSLTEKAHAFLTSVRDLGLIDESMEEEILNKLMMSPGGTVSFEDVRKTAAQTIFDRQFRSGEEYYGIFEEEWKLLFN